MRVSTIDIRAPQERREWTLYVVRRSNTWCFLAQFLPSFPRGV